MGADVLLFDRDREQFVTLNATAADVWRLADGSHTLDEIVALLASSYQTDADSIGEDVAAIVDELIDGGLLQTQKQP